MANNSGAIKLKMIKETKKFKEYNMFERSIAMPEDFDLEDYTECPFAIEVVNGEIVNLSPEFQKRIKDTIIEKLDISEKELVRYLLSLNEDEEIEDDRFELLSEYSLAFYNEILGFDTDSGEFSFSGIGMFDYEYGWEAKELLESLGIELMEIVDDTYSGRCGGYAKGVVYYEDTND